MPDATGESFGDALKRLRKEAHLSQPQLADMVHVSPSSLSRYESGKQAVDVATAARLDESLGAGGLLRLLMSESASTPDLGMLPVHPTSAGGSNSGLSSQHVQGAAHESWNHAMAVASSMADSTVDLMKAEVARLVSEYTATPAQVRFGELVGARNLLFGLLERSRKPADTRDLYVLAGRVCVMLAYTSQDLGFADAGASQARSAWAYAKLAGYDDLRVHARNVQANIVYWADRPAETVELVESELDAAPAARRAPLLFNHARALADLGRVDDALESLRAANAAADMEPPDHLWGGTSFEWRPASGLLLSASTCVRLGRGEKAAALASESLATYRARARGEKPSNAESRALLELACARVLTNELDGAAEALRPVLELDPRYRAERLVGRVDALRNTLRRSRFAAARETRELAERADLFVDTSLPRTVPRELRNSL
ncbi:helix-turn-helix domain-containing protein [Pseudonocardia acaciae]|uniref:helix-turn-helix transcriptional regulator n=1 Tax=Pseudonocardia acaciae TaxID=551276 RepID=UPI00048FB389